MPLSHVDIPVTGPREGHGCYQAASKPLGMGMTMEVGPEPTRGGGTAIGFGAQGENELFWIDEDEKVDEGLHVAFEAESRAKINALHMAATAAGRKDNGKPGLRPHYGADCYAAFVLHPDGANIEAFFDEPA